MYGHILAPLKRDANDEVVVEHASSLARVVGGRLTLLHVVHSHSRDESVYLEQEAGQYLAGWAERTAATGLQVEARVVQGEPAEAINKAAEELGADLIVMATHGHSELRHVLAGSVTEDVVRNGDVPVLLVRQRGRS
jgi:nucleotide-binding universal stress UspA family protein